MSEITIVNTIPKLKCHCGSVRWLLRGDGKADWDDRPIEECTFISVICTNCGNSQGLLGHNKKDWTFEKFTKK